MDLTHSRPIYSLQSKYSPNSILPSTLLGNWVIATLTLTLTLIDRETSLISVNQVVVTPKPKSNKKTQKNWQIYYNDKNDNFGLLFQQYTASGVGNIYHKSIVNERKDRMDKAAYEEKKYLGVYIPS